MMRIPRRASIPMPPRTAPITMPMDGLELAVESTTGTAVFVVVVEVRVALTKRDGDTDVRCTRCCSFN